MKINLMVLALAFAALVLGSPIAAAGLCLVIVVLMVGDALDGMPTCSGACNQGRAACTCSLTNKFK